MKVMITGASGYLGSNILKSLINNKNIDSISVIVHYNKPNVKSSKIKYFDNDVSSLKKAISNAKFIFHFAALYTTDNSIETLDKLIYSNIVLTTHILRLAADCDDCRVIMPTTYSMLTPQQELLPATFYASTKAFAEISANNFNTKVSFLRLPDTFGSNDKRNKILNLLLKSYFNHEKFHLTRGGDFKMNIISVEDILGIINMIINSNSRPEIEKLDLFYPINTITMGELVRLIDPCLNYLSTSDKSEIQNIITQKNVPSYQIKYPIRQRIKNEVNKIKEKM